MERIRATSPQEASPPALPRNGSIAAPQDYAEKVVTMEKEKEEEDKLCSLPREETPTNCKVTAEQRIGCSLPMFFTATRSLPSHFMHLARILPLGYFFSPWMFRP
jgi:hypothetical protein